MAASVSGSSARTARAAAKRERRSCRMFMEKSRLDGPVQPRLPFDAGGVGPEVLQIVEFAGLRAENVQNDVAEVVQDPTRILLPLDSPRARARRAHHAIDLFRHGVHLPAADA